MDCIRRPALTVNCGFARVSIYENSNPDRCGRYARSTIELSNRIDTFKSQFSAHHGYGIPANYFQATLGKDNLSQFDRDLNKILDGFIKPFPHEYSRDAYLATFSSQKWSQLTPTEKDQHSLSKCRRCYEQYKEHQMSFPLKPRYEPKPVVTIDLEALQQQGVHNQYCIRPE